MSVITKLKQVSVVLIGDFNPAMFQPEWFSKNEIISVEDAHIAEDNSDHPLLVTSQLTIFRTSLLDVKIEQKKFSVSCTKEPYLTVKDFITKTFESLSGVTIRAYGFNYSAHYDVGGREKQNFIGDVLAPKEQWKSLFGDDLANIDMNSGMSSIRMVKVKADGDGQITVVVEPSNFEKSGVFMTCNDHTNVDKINNSAGEVMVKLGGSFISILENLKAIQLGVLSEVLKDAE